jgi:hypothetical protein
MVLRLHRDSDVSIRYPAVVPYPLGVRGLLGYLHRQDSWGRLVTDAYMMRVAFGSLASDTSYFIVALAFGVFVATFAALKRGGLL